ncbi:MAG TPA: hypothetical protein PKA10_00015 [Selenomonadales bacterium]|nr:hypothetical protein [Selenomonadales bacterium]
MPSEMKEILNQFGENEQNAVRRFQGFHREEEPGAFPDVPEKSGAGAEKVYRQLLRKYNLSQEMLMQKVDQGQVAEMTG